MRDGSEVRIEHALSLFDELRLGTEETKVLSADDLYEKLTERLKGGTVKES